MNQLHFAVIRTLCIEIIIILWNINNYPFVCVSTWYFELMRFELQYCNRRAGNLRKLFMICL